MNIVGIIPARIGSSRFPGKPLAEILGKAMIYHVYYRSKMAKVLSEVYIATCDNEIEKYCLDNNMKVVMTKDTHQRASDRAFEAAQKIEKLEGQKIDIVVMIQGDEPMLFPEMIEESIKPFFSDKTIQVANLMSKINSREEQDDPNSIKVVVDENSFALYFSRQPIPYWKKEIKEPPVFKQVCIIPFKRDFLAKFSALSSGPLEILESIDMLRVLEHGYKVKMVLTQFQTHSVDTPFDLQRVESLMEKDSLVAKYSGSTA